MSCVCVSCGAWHARCVLCVRSLRALLVPLCVACAVQIGLYSGASGRFLTPCMPFHTVAGAEAFVHADNEASLYARVQYDSLSGDEASAWLKANPMARAGILLRLGETRSAEHLHAVASAAPPAPPAPTRLPGAGLVAPFVAMSTAAQAEAETPAAEEPQPVGLEALVCAAVRLPLVRPSGAWREPHLGMTIAKLPRLPIVEAFLARGACAAAVHAACDAARDAPSALAAQRRSGVRVRATMRPRMLSALRGGSPSAGTRLGACVGIASIATSTTHLTDAPSRARASWPPPLQPMRSFYGAFAALPLNAVAPSSMQLALPSQPMPSRLPWCSGSPQVQSPLISAEHGRISWLTCPPFRSSLELRPHSSPTLPSSFLSPQPPPPRPLKQ